MTVQVNLLGEVHAQLADGGVDFSANKSYQALAYLAYRGDWVSRDDMAFLFWADHDKSAAQRQATAQTFEEVELA